MKSYASPLIIALAFTASVAAHYARIIVPPVPAGIDAPDGTRPFLVQHAVGTQGYLCVAVGTTYSWATYGPQATLFDDEGEQQLTHFLSPNPLEGGALYPTWQHSRDSSRVWATPIATSSDANYVAPGAIPWLLLRVVGREDGPGGGDRLSPATYIQRLNTVGGMAPSTGCSQTTDIKKRALVPYEADYFFYRAARGGRDD